MDQNKILPPFATARQLRPFVTTVNPHKLFALSEIIYHKKCSFIIASKVRHFDSHNVVPKALSEMVPDDVLWKCFCNRFVVWVVLITKNILVFNLKLMFVEWVGFSLLHWFCFDDQFCTSLLLVFFPLYDVFLAALFLLYHHFFKLRKAPSSLCFSKLSVSLLLLLSCQVYFYLFLVQSK